MNEPLLKSIEARRSDEEEPIFPVDPSQEHVGSFSISERNLNLFPSHLRATFSSLRWNDCHFESQDNVIAVFDTDYERLENFYADMLNRIQKGLKIGILLLIFSNIYSFYAIYTKLIRYGAPVPGYFIYTKFCDICLVILAVSVMRRAKHNSKLELIRHIAVTTEGVHIETNQNCADLIFRKKNVAIMKIPFADIISCKHDFLMKESYRKIFGGCGLDFYERIGKILLLKTKDKCITRPVEGIINGEALAVMVTWLKENNF